MRNSRCEAPCAAAEGEGVGWHHSGSASYDSINGAVGCKTAERSGRYDDDSPGPPNTGRCRKGKIMATLLYGNFWLCACYALSPPFFPEEAEKKGANATEYGFVFGIYQLMIFVISPVYGRLLPVVKPYFMLKAGTFVAGVCAILFGFLDKAPGGSTFLALAFVVRSVEALGAASFYIASYTLLAMEFRDNVSTAMAYSEVSFSLGLALGPVFGGLLYQYGGYSLPFIVLGVVLMTSTGISCIVFRDSDDPIAKPSGNVLKLFFDLGFIVDFLNIAMCFLIIGFNDVTLETHLRQFSLSSALVGVIFMTYGAVDVVTATCWGQLCKRVPNTYVLLAISCLMGTICFIIVGPAPFLPFSTKLWVVILSQVLLGLGMSGAMVCGFYHALNDAVIRGFPDNEATYALVSSALLSAFSLGSFIGPSLGGFLMDKIGYAAASSVIATMEGVLTLFVVFCAVRDYYYQRTGYEKLKTAEPAVT